MQVYPRANLPKECYRGNRWAYETECNVLGWKLAWLNAAEISGKRGLIQRAVDSYRNRNPSMRSRRVARQEKLLKGTLRRRKNTNEGGCATTSTMTTAQTPQQHQHQQQQQKVISIEDPVSGTRLRLKVNVEDVSVETIPLEFQKANCVFPRAMNVQPDTAPNTVRWQEEAQCNELGFKLVNILKKDVWKEICRRRNAK